MRQFSPSMDNGYHPYNPDFFIRLFAIEDRHFWFRARNQVISALVKLIIADPIPGYRVLEVGCGTGNVLRVLERAFPNNLVIGMDLFAEGLCYARQRLSCSLVHGDVYFPPFRKPFHLIGLFDVLEHIPDDIEILRHLHSLLVPGGTLLLTVPAHPSLWSYFDEASHHCRRYKPAELENKLIRTGYRVEYLSQYMVSIFPLVWLGRRLQPLFKRSSVKDSDRMHALSATDLRIIPVINKLLAFLLTQEIHLIARRRRLPMGTSLIAIAGPSNGSFALRMRE